MKTDHETLRIARKLLIKAEALLDLAIRKPEVGPGWDAEDVAFEERIRRETFNDAKKAARDARFLLA